MVNQNFTLTKGDSLEFTITLEDSEIAPTDIAFIVKDNVNSVTPTLTKLLSKGEIERISETEYIYNIYIDYTESDQFKLLNYIYQIELTFGSTKDTVVEGKLVITPEL